MNFTIQDFIKLIITVCVIFACSQIGRKLPTLAGLIAMPMYHIIKTEDENTSYLSLNIGILF